MKKILVILAVFLTSYSYTQINLVINPSFEDTVSCPALPGQINRAIGWHTLISGGGGTPELFHVCCHPNNLCGVPQNTPSHGFQFPKTGNAYAGIDVAYFNGTLREYIQSKLNDKLKIGDVYCVKFHVNLYNSSAAYIIPLGAYFDDGSVITTSSHGIAYANAFMQAVNPQVVNSAQLLSDTLNWMKIEGSFVATGTEEYITIGNFFPDTLSGIGFFGSPTSWASYYYIDDVSVIPANLPAYAGNDTLIQPGDSVFIGRQPEIGLDEDCIWFVNGLPIDTVAGLWVQPDSTTTYIVQQTICGNVTWDTVTVTVDTGVGMTELTNGLAHRFKVYPNPATNLLTVETPVENVRLVITNLLGQLVLEHDVRVKQFNLDISVLSKGVYFIRADNEKISVVRKFIKE